MTITRTIDVVHGAAELDAALEESRRASRSIAFVPTMGALHDGHAALVRAARATHDVVVVSCYVNPLQFGAGEDLDRYPRTPEHDLAVASDAGADLLWLPTDEDVYGSSARDANLVQVGALGTMFEGAARPGHFDGVAAVVARLLAAVRPDALYLGEKDYQQVVVIRELIKARVLPVAVHVVATVREADGLARSSRNAYLGPGERAAAVVIPRALDAARAAAARGERDARVIERAARDELAGEAMLDVDYVALVDPRTLTPIDDLVGAGRLLVAVSLAGTRLIDNIEITPHPNDGEHSLAQEPT